MSEEPTGTVPPIAADGTFAQAAPAIADPTGDERVDAALGRLAELPGAAVSAHVEIFEDVHRRLQDVLTSVDEQALLPGPPAPGGHR